MKKTYTRKQIKEAISYWKKQLNEQQLSVQDFDKMTKEDLLKWIYDKLTALKSEYDAATNAIQDIIDDSDDVLESFEGVDFMFNDIIEPIGRAAGHYSTTLTV